MKKIFIDGGARMGESIDIIKKDMPKYSDFEFYLFEPNTLYSDHLYKLSSNSINFNFINGALWDKSGNYEFFISNDVWGDVGSTLHIEKKEKLDRINPIYVKTFDIIEVLEWFSKDDYIVLKLDVEGSEYDIIDRLIKENKVDYIKEYLVEWHDHFYDNINKKSSRYISEISKKSLYKTWLY